MLDIAGRRQACEDTIRRTPALAAAAVADGIHLLQSTFIPAQLPPLDKSSPSFPGFERPPITVHDSDAFALARAISSERGHSHSKVGVLNLASDREPGGGWRYTLDKTQEEALCYSSTLYATLNPLWFPWPNMGPGSCAGIMTPNVLVFKDTIDHDLVDLAAPQQQIVAVMTVAAPCFPKLTDDREDFADPSQLHDLQEKIRLTLRMAASNGITKLVLGAMGCGVYGCPPRAVAREMRHILDEDEFDGWFETITFAVYVVRQRDTKNFDLFSAIVSRA